MSTHYQDYEWNEHITRKEFTIRRQNGYRPAVEQPKEAKGKKLV